MNGIEDTKARVEERLALRRIEFDRASTKERRMVALALTSFACGIAMALLSLDGLYGFHWSWTPLSVVALLVIMVILREEATRRRKRLGFAVAWLERWLARLDDDWEHGQDGGSEYSDEAHAYTSDLDVFGAGSLFERLNETHTVLGRDALAAILQDRVAGEQTADRQDAVRELRDDVDLREDFEVELRSLSELSGDDPVHRARLDQDTRKLLEWGMEETRAIDPLWLILLQTLLGLTASFTFVAHFTLGWNWGPFIAHYLLNLVLLGRAKDIEGLLEQFEKVRETLEAWSRCLLEMERHEPRSPLLRDIRAPLVTGDVPASFAIKRLKRLADRLSWRRNMFWAMTFDVLWLWDLHACRSLLRWKRRHGHELDGWLRAAGRLEAQLNLSAYAAAVPDSCYPTLQAEGPLLEGAGLAHPLLARATRVGNDLRVKERGFLLLVTGSNMSGKSTFLRTVGLAVLMTRTGLPVPAERFSLRGMHVVTCMRVHDSLKSGSSQFHAEVTRLAQCVKWASAEGPTLVLLDEILAGTNSRERHVGTLAVMRSLATLNTTTLVATHDLALAELEQEFPTALRTVHFRDLIRDDVMSFDYEMREGPLPSTNALRVMHAAGLDVPEDAE